VGRRRAPRDGSGFSLIEILLGVALLLIVTTAVFALLAPAEGGFGAALEAVDMEQRLRVATDTLTQDLAMAGAGADAGSCPGPLSDWLPPVLPFKRGEIDSDPTTTFRRDTISLLYVPADAAQGTLAASIGPGQLQLRVDRTGCSHASSLCGFASGMTILVYDGSGAFDSLTVVSASGAEAQLRANRPGGVLRRTYAAGSQVTEAVQRSYYLDNDVARGTHQLMRSDGSSRAAVPVVDHVVDLAFEYAGDPRPPRLLKSVSEPDGPWTTYGPRPPAPGVTQPPFAAGENCIFAFDPRRAVYLPRQRALGPRTTLVQLDAGELADGNVWCPDASDPDRYDADLLRIRTVRVTVRVQSAIAAFRGPAGVLFRQPGDSSGAGRLLPDRELHFQISPPNVSLAR
jgi:hypothetical protein